MKTYGLAELEFELYQNNKKDITTKTEKDYENLNSGANSEKEKKESSMTKK